MAVSGNQLTRIGAWLSGVGRKLSFTAKSPGAITGTPTFITGIVTAPGINGNIKATSVTGIVTAPSITGRII